MDNKKETIAERVKIATASLQFIAIEIELSTQLDSATYAEMHSDAHVH